MRGLGTAINALAILAGGALGILCRSFLQERYQDTIIKGHRLFSGVSGRGRPPLQNAERLAGRQRL